jgi:hypothetical protein
MLPLLDEAAATALSVANLVIEAFSSPRLNVEVVQNSQRVASVRGLNEDVTAVAAYVLQQKKRIEQLGFWF